jgi:hypothetical protein
LHRQAGRANGARPDHRRDGLRIGRGLTDHGARRCCHSPSRRLDRAART